MHGLCAKDIRQMIKQYMEIALADEQNDIGPTLSTFGQQCCQHNANTDPANDCYLGWLTPVKKSSVKKGTNSLFQI